MESGQGGDWAADLPVAYDVHLFADDAIVNDHVAGHEDVRADGLCVRTEVAYSSNYTETASNDERYTVRSGLSKLEANITPWRVMKMRVQMR